MIYSKSRLEALSDGIVAIVATLLILLIEVPEMDDPTRSEVAQWFRDSSHILWAYAVSFIIIGNYWWLHSLLMEEIRCVDHLFAMLNLIFLLIVAVIPFATHFVIDLAFTQVESLAEIFYGINQVLICGCLLLMRYYAHRRGDLLKADQQSTNTGRVIKINCFIYLAALAITVATTTFVLFIYLFVPLATLFAQRFL